MSALLIDDPSSEEKKAVTSSPHVGSKDGPKKVNSLYGDLSVVLSIIEDFMGILNQLQLTNASVMQQFSSQEVKLNQDFEDMENKEGSTDPYNPPSVPYHNALWQLKQKGADENKWSTIFQADNAKNQAAIKSIDSFYTQWQAVVNQNNQNQQPILSVGNAITQWISNFLRYIHV